MIEFIFSVIVTVLLYKAFWNYCKKHDDYGGPFNQFGDLF